nr:hypothetical protein [Tanacetum cinerariifolium]
MVTKLMTQMAVQGEQLKSMSIQLTPPDVSLVDINPIDSSADDEGETHVVGRENDVSIQMSNGLATLEKEMETRETVNYVVSKKMTRSIGIVSSRQDFQLQENVSQLLVLPQAIKCKLWHLKKSTIIGLGTVYETVGKQMPNNKELPKDCYKVSIDKSLVDAACTPDAFLLLEESSHWQYNFPLPVEGVPTARGMEIPLPRVCTAMIKKLPVKEIGSYTKKMAYVLPIIVAVTEMYNSMYKDSLYYKRSPLVLA